MLCASGFEFEEKLRQAAEERAKAQRAQRTSVELNRNRLKYIENAIKRYDRSLVALVDHKRACTLCNKP